MLNLHPLECTIKDNDHISDLLLANYWVITSCIYFIMNVHLQDAMRNPSAVTFIHRSIIVMSLMKGKE